MTMSTKERLNATVELFQQIVPLFANSPPDVVAAVLADLLAMWITYHPQHMQDELLSTHISYVKQLIACYEEKQPNEQPGPRPH